MNHVIKTIKKRVDPISHQLNSFLKNSGLPAEFFCHDMTFGKGMAALLSSNAGVPSDYYSKRTPFVFTNENGRTLDEGAYLGQYLCDSAEYSEQLSAFKNQFAFQHILIIVAPEKDHQHQYSFCFTCTEAQFLHHVVNNYYLYQQFINRYAKQFSDVIDCERENYQVEFPLSDTTPPNNLSFLSINHNKINHIQCTDIHSDLANLLSPQQIKCFTLLVQGLSSKDIAYEMQLSHRTIEHYIAATRAKLNSKNTKELIAKYSTQI